MPRPAAPASLLGGGAPGVREEPFTSVASLLHFWSSAGAPAATFGPLPLARGRPLGYNAAATPLASRRERPPAASPLSSSDLSAELWPRTSTQQQQQQ